MGTDPQPSDEDLAAAAAKGDAAAMELLLRRHMGRIHAICRRITCHSEDAHDATQEAMVSIHRSIASFDGRSTFATWMYRVATNAALMEVRRRGRRPMLLDDPDVAHHDHPHLAEEATVAERLDVDAALERLAPEFRAAVVLRDLCDLDYPAIAMVLDIPEGTVRSRIHRGRRLLRTLLADEPPDPR